MKKKYVIFIIVLLIVVCICSALTYYLLSEDKPEEFKQSYKFPDKVIMIDAHSYEDGRVIHVACDEYSHDLCEIRQDKYPYENALRSCTFNIKRTKPVALSIVTVPFGENRTIIMWSDNGGAESVTISIINLIDCNVTTNYKIRVSNSTLDRRKIVTYNDTFDVFFKNPNQCGSNECKLTMNAEGKIVKGLVGFVDNTNATIVEVYPIAAHSDSKGFVYSKLRENEKIKEIFLLQPNGTQQQFDTFSKSDIISVVGESIGMCHEIDSSIVCNQYSSDGKLNFRFSSNAMKRDASNMYNISLYNIYTLPKEGFLMHFRECENTLCFGETDLTIVKFNATGKVVGQLNHLKFNGSTHEVYDTYMWKKGESKDYCAIASFISEDNADIFGKCFNDVIFST